MREGQTSFNTYCPSNSETVQATTNVDGAAKNRKPPGALGAWSTSPATTTRDTGQDRFVLPTPRSRPIHEQAGAPACLPQHASPVTTNRRSYECASSDVGGWRHAAASGSAPMSAAAELSIQRALSVRDPRLVPRNCRVSDHGTVRTYAPRLDRSRLKCGRCRPQTDVRWLHDAMAD